MDHLQRQGQGLAGPETRFEPERRFVVIRARHEPAVEDATAVRG